MKHFTVHSGYRQFYVGDVKSNFEAPEDWTDENIRERHNTLQNVTALVPENDITANIISYGPNDVIEEQSLKEDFFVETVIEVPSGIIGIYGWPRELKDKYKIRKGKCKIEFYGYNIDMVEDNKDYYIVKIIEV